MNLFRTGKEFLQKYPSLLTLASWCCRLFGMNRIHYGGIFNHKGNTLDSKKGFLLHCKINYIGGGNIIILGKKCYLDNCRVSIHGNNNIINFEDMVCVHNGEFCIENDNNRILIGEKSLICGPSHFAAIEGTTIKLGKDCLVSSETFFRTGDSHSVLDMDGNRINRSKDIIIEDHVWICHRAGCTKGAEIAVNSILATGAICTKSFQNKNVVLAGIPARETKNNITWCKERI